MLQIVKDLAKKGYELNFEQLKRLMDNMPENIKTVSKIEQYIPVYNVIKTVASIFSFIKNKDLLYECMSNLGSIQESEIFDKNDNDIELVIKGACKTEEEAKKIIYKKTHYYMDISMKKLKKDI